MNLKVALQAVIDEINRSEKKFPGFPTDPIHAAAIVNEESGELCRAALMLTYEHPDVWGSVCHEAVHTAAMAIRFLMMMERMRRRPSKQVKKKEGFK